MSDYAKYSFDKAFDGGQGARSDEEIARVRAEAEAQRKKAYDQGFEQGRAQARQELEAQILELMQQAMGAVSQLFAERQSVEQKLVQNAVQLAHTVGCRLASAAEEAYPLAEVETLVSDSFAAIAEQPVLQLRVAPDLAEAAEKRVKSYLDKQGFEGTLTVRGDGQLGGSNCRLEWSDGAVSRDSNAIAEKLNALLDSYLKSPEKLSESDDQAAEPAELAGGAAPHDQKGAPEAAAPGEG